ncbi:unnamed protein product [Auanema sp. JU1783]|nr:unnamed protein product [Auanema sp. JU1783]
MLLRYLQPSSEHQLKRQRSELLTVLVLLISIVVWMVVGVSYAVPLIKLEKKTKVLEVKPSPSLSTEEKCSSTCRIEITEDFPENLPFDYSQLKFNNSYTIFTDLFENAREEILIMASSSNLRAKEYDHEYRERYAKRGNEIYELLKKRGLIDDIRIRLIDVGGEVDSVKYRDAEELHRALERRTHDTMPMVIQHSKSIIVDDVHSLITSANLDYLSLQQKGELGVLVKNCPCFAADLKQIYNNMWNSAGGSLVVFQSQSPYNHQNRLRIGKTQIHTAISPDIMRESGRDSELNEILRLINEAEKEVHISVMDFVPFFHFMNSNQTMSEMSEAVINAASRGVNVRIMTMSRHSNFRAETLQYFQKLSRHSSNIEIKLHSFPYENVYMDRKSHGKSVLTEKEFLISTSNFTPDYFYADTGLSVVIKEDSVQKPLMRMIKEINRRYWNGPYSYDLEYYVKMCSPISLDKDICDAINSLHADRIRRV